MICSYCKKPAKLAFELLEDKTGKNTLKKIACFPCLSEIGRKEMAEHEKAYARPEGGTPNAS
jgi:hypothetical protein